MSLDNDYHELPPPPNHLGWALVLTVVGALILALLWAVVVS
jgi:hypothetical protein